MAAPADDESLLIHRIQALEDDIILREAMIDSLSLAVNASPSREPAIQRDLETLRTELALLKTQLLRITPQKPGSVQHRQQLAMQDLFVNNSPEELDADASPLAKRTRFTVFDNGDGDEAPLFVFDTEGTLHFAPSSSSSSSAIPATLSQSHSIAANSSSDASPSALSDEFLLSLGVNLEEQTRLELGFNTRKRERESELTTRLHQQELEDARLARQLEREDAQEREKIRLQQMHADEALAKVLAAKWGAVESSSTSSSTTSAPSNSFVISDDDEDAWDAPHANQLEDDERLARQLQAEEDLLIKEGLLPRPTSPHRSPAGAQARQLSPPPPFDPLQNDMLQVWRDMTGVAPVSPSLPPSPAPLPPQPQASPQDLLAIIHAPEDLAPQIPRADQPDGLLSSLMEHQKIGLAWMVSMEEGNVKGGILADDMGLGKTVQTIALILARPFRPPSRRRSTLIVAPVALVHQWAGEIASKVDDETLSVYLHHGPKRATEAKELEKYDVVITTYNLLSIEASTTSSDSSSSRRWPLAECKFHRVILDEAHVIKNSITGQARGCFNIDADYRWCLTATPIQNSYEDLFSLIHFLRVKPYCDRALFQREISFAIKVGRPSGIEALQNVVKAVMLRRTKLSRVGGQPILTLPQRHVHITHAPFSDDESRFYEWLEEKAVRAFRRYLDTNTVMRNYSHVLVLLLRLRQACLHSSLIQDIEGVGAHAGQVVTKWAENQQAVLEVAQRMSKDVVKRVSEEGLNGYECPICMDLAVDPKIVFLCGHIYCNECLMGHLNRPGNDGEKTCPGCRGALEIDLLITVAAFKQVHMRVDEPPSLDTDVEKGKAKADDAELLKPPAVTSAKIERMLAILEETRTTNPGEKTIIFSSFTRMLDLIESPLQSAGYKFVRYDGTMNVSKRTIALRALNTDPRTTVMIVSTKCGALGLNLNVANRVILLDVWWNSALDNQAIDRVHRIGQTKSVEVHRVVVPGTIEERMLVLQERKQAVANNALGEDGSNKAERLGLEELMYLFFGE